MPSQPASGRETRADRQYSAPWDPPKPLRPHARGSAPVEPRARRATVEVPNDEELIGAIILASRAMVAIAVRSLAGNADEVTLPQYRTLVVLTYGGPKRLADLADALA